MPLLPSTTGMLQDALVNSKDVLWRKGKYDLNLKYAVGR